MAARELEALPQLLKIDVLLEWRRGRDEQAPQLRPRQRVGRRELHDELEAAVDCQHDGACMRCRVHTDKARLMRRSAQRTCSVDLLIPIRDGDDDARELLHLRVVRA